MGYLTRATKEQKQCRLDRHLFTTKAIVEYKWNGSAPIYGVDLHCTRCGVIAFDVIDHNGEKIGHRRYSYDNADDYLVHRDEDIPTKSEIRYELIVRNSRHKKSLKTLPQWQKDMLIGAVDKRVSHLPRW